MNQRTIVVSDMHAGDAGPLEDFKLDDAFGAFLDFHSDGHTRLILNGDTFDFLQVQPLGTLTVRAIPDKLRAVCAAHPGLIKALAGFTRRGNQIDVVEGNHDIELVLEDVQEAFRDEVVAAGGDPTRIGFARLAIDDIKGIHIEHGHQTDPLNCFDYEHLLRVDATGTLQYPWGSHFVMRVFNAIEPEYRFIDKVRPEEAAALLLYLVDPALFKANIPGLLGLKAEGWLNGFRVAAGKPAAGKRSKGSMTEAWAFAAAWEEIFADLQVLEISGRVPAGMRGKGALDAPLRKLILHLSHRWETELAKNRSYDFVAAREIAARTGARVVIFGHTHHMARARLGGRAEYINSGTWTPLLSMPLEQDAARWVAEAREQKAYRTFNKPSFVRISEAGEAELLTWDESLSRPAPAGY